MIPTLQLGGLGRRGVAGGGVGDPYWANVTLLLGNDNAADGTTTFADQSSSGLSLTVRGNSQYDDAQAPAGMSTSMLFDGNDWLNLPAAAGLTLSGDFTIEAMLRKNGNDDNAFIFGYNLSFGNVQCRVDESAAGDLSMYNGTSYLRGGAQSCSNTWRHFAYSRSGTDLRFFQDGTQVGSTMTAAGTFNFSQLAVAAGVNDQNTFLGGGINGWLANLRVTKDVARYTAGFTPPTFPLPTS